MTDQRFAVTVEELVEQDHFFFVGEEHPDEVKRCRDREREGAHELSIELRAVVDRLLAQHRVAALFMCRNICFKAGTIIAGSLGLRLRDHSPDEPIWRFISALTSIPLEDFDVLRKCHQAQLEREREPDLTLAAVRIARINTETVINWAHDLTNAGPGESSRADAARTDVAKARSHFLTYH